MWWYLLKNSEEMFIFRERRTFWQLEGLGSYGSEGQARKSGILGCEPNLSLTLFLL